ncbi:MAG: Arm DNA-binding domain-containing protein, partial [Erysipelotrichaceae bacterium]
MSVYKAPNGTYYVQASFKNNNGDRKQKKIRGFETKKEAKIAEAEFLLSSKNKINTKYTYEMVYKLFIEAKETKGIKSRSLMNYNETNKKHILPVFGKMLITNINKETIRNWQTVLKQKGYKTSYLKTIQSTFNRVLRWAVEDD